MKISYVLQLKDFSLLFLFGAIIGVFYGLFNILPNIKPNLILQIILDFIFSILIVSIFIILINKVNMGEIRLFLLIGYSLGFAMERITLGKLFAKGYKMLYTYIVNMTQWFANSKLGRILLK